MQESIIIHAFQRWMIMAKTEEERRQALRAMFAQTREGQKQPGEQPVVRPPERQPQREVGPAVPIRQAVREATVPPTVGRERQASDKERLAEVSLGAPSREFVRDVMARLKLASTLRFMAHPELTLRRMQLYDMFGPERRESA
jgi:hypothetical protein